MDDTLKKNCIDLSEIYTFWYHNPDNLDWSLESYIELLEFSGFVISMVAEVVSVSDITSSS